MGLLETETELIRLIREDGDSDALQLLVQRYQPMIENFYHQYHISLYDRSDWDQIGYIVCHETCHIFNGSSGSKFGSFFKLRFKNHIIDTIRRQATNKRQANHLAQSYEMIIPTELPAKLIREYGHLENTTDYIKSIIADFSRLELQALRFMLGEIDLQAACALSNCTEEQLKRAGNRCQAKFLESLLN